MSILCYSMVQDFALDSESDSDNDCDNSAVKSMSTEVDDHILNQLNLEEANTTSSVEQVADIECISRSTRRPSIARSERRRQAGRSSKSPISSPSVRKPCETCHAYYYALLLI